jgi:transcription antitermination factor NusG
MVSSTFARDITSLDTSSVKCWYALKVWTRSETLASNALRNRGYEPFSPVYPERRRYADRIKVVDTAAFPGYIFCRFILQLKVPVLSSPSVEYIVGIRGRPTPIADAEIDAISRYIAAGGRPVPYLQIGQRVRIEYGALAGIEGILTRVDGQHRLTLSIDLLQRSLALQIDADQVRPT